MTEDPDAVEYVGRIDGQTGWTGVNQDGNKIMSYQFAIIIRAAEGKTLKDIFAVDREADKATQIGWWIPYRNEKIPPEKWTMNLIDVNLKSDVTGSTLNFRQTLWNKGLYDAPKASIDGYLDEFDTEQNVSTWKFARDTGILSEWSDNDQSLKNKDDYFVPIPELSRISEDMLIIALEGSSLKLNLPDVRGGSTGTLRFQLVDFDLTIPGRRIRDKYDVDLTWSQYENRCTLPADCPDPVLEEESAVGMLSGVTAMMLAAVMALAF